LRRPALASQAACKPVPSGACRFDSCPTH